MILHIKKRFSIGYNMLPSLKYPCIIVVQSWRPDFKRPIPYPNNLHKCTLSHSPTIKIKPSEEAFSNIRLKSLTRLETFHILEALAPESLPGQQTSYFPHIFYYDSPTRLDSGPSVFWHSATHFNPIENFVSLVTQTSPIHSVLCQWRISQDPNSKGRSSLV